MADNTISRVAHGVISKPLEAAGAIASKSDGVVKTGKFIITIIDILQNICTRIGKAAILGATVVLKGKLKVVAEVIDGLNIFNRLAEWFCPESGKDKPYWLAKTNTKLEKFILRTKTVGRVFLTAANAIEFTKLLDAFGFIKLGRIASTTLGRLPVLNLVKDVCVIVASVFSITSSAGALVKDSPKLSQAQRKLNRWNEAAKALRQNKEVETLEDAITAVQIKKTAINVEKTTLNAQEPQGKKAVAAQKKALKDLDKRLKKLDKEQKQLEARLEKAESEKVQQALETSAKKAQDRFIANCNSKIASYKEKQRVALAKSAHLINEAAVKGVDNAAKVNEVQRTIDLMEDKIIKWDCKLSYITGSNPLRGLREYCELKLDYTCDKAEAAVDKISERVDALNNAEGLSAAYGPIAQERMKETLSAMQLVEKLASKAKSIAANGLAAAETYDTLNALRDHNKVETYIDHHVEVLKADKSNAGRKVSKHWVAIACDISKIAIIIMGIIGLSLGIAAFGWVMSVAALALLVNSLGLFKFLFDELVASKTVKAPKLVFTP